MGNLSANSTIIRKLLISAAALGVTVANPAPAFADGGHGRHRGHHDNYRYQPRHYDYSYGHYRPYRNYDYYNYSHHRRGHISAGEGALIAAGIIGGVILIDRALDNRDRHDDRVYDDNNRRGAVDDDYYYRRDDRPYDSRSADWDHDGRDYNDRPADENYRSAGSDREIDDALLGDNRQGGASPTVLADAAFRDCIAETRGAAGAGGMNVAMPGAPTEVERLADGSVRMTAQFRASNPRGESWTRRFVCEADDQGVRFLQVD